MIFFAQLALTALTLAIVTAVVIIAWLGLDGEPKVGSFADEVLGLLAGAFFLCCGLTLVCGAVYGIHVVWSL